MHIQDITGFFTRHKKSLLGVCASLAQRFSLPPVALRVALVILTFLFIPLGIIIYIISYLAIKPSKTKMITFALLGAVLGVPLSYYFQSDLVKLYDGTSGVFGYLRNFTKTVDEYNEYFGNGWDIIYNVFFSIVIFALVGGAIGYYLDKKKVKTMQ